MEPAGHVLLSVVTNGQARKCSYSSDISIFIFYMLFQTDKFTIYISSAETGDASNPKPWLLICGRCPVFSCGIRMKESGQDLKTVVA